MEVKVLDIDLLSQLLIPGLTPNKEDHLKSAIDMSSYLAHIIQNPNEVDSDEFRLEGLRDNTDREILKPSDWALKYRLFKGKPMTYHNFPYQRQILDDLHPKQVIEKSAQMGISEIMLTKLFWFGDYNMGKAIYTFPTFKDMLQYAASRLPQIIEGSIDCTPDDPYWNMKMVDNPKTYIQSMLYVNNASMRRINDFFIYYKGTFGDGSAISVDSDWNIHDEVNFSNQNVLNKFKSRLGASDMKWEYNFSTPTIPGYGVSTMFQKSDMQMWHVKCPKCNAQFKMEFDRHVKELAFGKGYIYQCHGCQSLIEPDTIRNGIWIASSPSNTGVRGYHISKMMNPRFTANELVDSKNGYRRISDFYNFDLGESYSEKSTALTLEIMRGIQRPYQMWGSAKKEHQAVMGIDQGDILWVTISVPDEIDPSKEKIIYVESIDSQDYDDEDPFQRLPELWDRYNIQYAVIDGNPNKNSARWFKNKYPGRVCMAFYTATRDGDMSYRLDEGMANIDRTEMFKGLFNDIVTNKLITPSGFDIMERFNSHHIALKKETEENDDTGERKEYFIRTGHDHLAHANLYRKVARMIMTAEVGTGAVASVGMKNNPHWSGRQGYARRVGEPANTRQGGLGKIPKTLPNSLRK